MTKFKLTILILLITAFGVVVSGCVKKPQKVNYANPQATSVVVDRGRNQNVSATTTPTTPAEVPLVKDGTKGAIGVQWNDWPAEVPYGFFDYESVQNLADHDDFIKNYYQGSVNQYLGGFKFYKIGVVKNGPFIGDQVYIVIYQPEGPSRPETYRVIKSGDKNIILSKHSSVTPYGFSRKLFLINDDVTITNFDVPETISIPNSNLLLEQADREPYRFLTSYDDTERVFKYDGEKWVYRDNKQGCFLVAAADGTVREYYFNLAFAGRAGSPSQYVGATPYVLDLAWNNGSKNTQEYIFKSVGGCGASGCYNYASYLKDTTPLKQVGKASDGSPIYALKDMTLKASPKDENPVLKTMYDQYYPGYDSNTNQTKEKISFESFLADHPIIYWQDPFGKFIEFRNGKYLPAVECGKPVIYLYPTKQQDVTVTVEPAGGFTITEPEYRNGWMVNASPDGTLFNYADGKKYPYLFWEGVVLNYERPSEGFVVPKADVKQFLIDSLTKLGLVKAEYDEFIDFWLPKMQERNYYFISFVPQAEFDKIAPLTVSPKPDTVIRVFMDYTGLDDYVSVSPQALTAPQRKGFTVVEWGGALHP